MDEQIHGWRRRTGLLTLVISLAFMMCWLRSMSVEDFVHLLFRQRKICFESGRGQFLVMEWAAPIDSSNEATLKNWSNRIYRPDTFQLNDGAHESEVLDEERPLCGIIDPSLMDAATCAKIDAVISYVGTGRDCVTPTVIRIVVPYWSATLSVTVLSAHLLLSKPQRRAENA